MFIHTANSIYEVNKSEKWIRRMLGKTEPTPNLGRDSEWKSYRSLTSPSLHDVETGKIAIICWHDKKCTMTSLITKIDMDGFSN
jgi:hypothetical protein